MTTSKVELQPTATEVHFTHSEMVVALSDGRTLSVPMSWFPTLSNASFEQLQDYQLLGDGEGIHWPQLDEDLSVKGLLLGEHSWQRDPPSSRTR